MEEETGLSFGGAAVGRVDFRNVRTERSEKLMSILSHPFLTVLFISEYFRAYVIYTETPPAQTGGRRKQQKQKKMVEVI
jgi:uncharacterized membrane protein (UPF0127 family)